MATTHRGNCCSLLFAFATISLVLPASPAVAGHPPACVTVDNVVYEQQTESVEVWGRFSLFDGLLVDGFLRFTTACQDECPGCWPTCLANDSAARRFEAAAGSGEAVGFSYSANLPICTYSHAPDDCPSPLLKCLTPGADPALCVPDSVPGVQDVAVDFSDYTAPMCKALDPHPGEDGSICIAKEDCAAGLRCDHVKDSTTWQYVCKPDSAPYPARCFGHAECGSPKEVCATDPMICTLVPCRNGDDCPSSTQCLPAAYSSNGYCAAIDDWYEKGCYEGPLVSENCGNDGVECTYRCEDPDTVCVGWSARGCAGCDYACVPVGCRNKDLDPDCAGVFAEYGEEFWTPALGMGMRFRCSDDNGLCVLDETSIPDGGAPDAAGEDAGAGDAAVPPDASAGGGGPAGDATPDPREAGQTPADAAMRDTGRAAAETGIIPAGCACAALSL